MGHVKNMNDLKRKAFTEKICDLDKFEICWQKFCETNVSKFRQKEMCFIHL